MDLKNPYELIQVVQHYLETHPWVSSYGEAGSWVAKQLEASVPDDPLRILEIGSGGAEFALSLITHLELARRPFNLCLVEPSGLMRRSEAHAQIEKEATITVCKHAFPQENCPGEQASFNCIISLLSLHHIPDWRIHLDRIIERAGDSFAVVLGVAIGDAILVSTGERQSGSDAVATAFWSEYHVFLKAHSYLSSDRPSELKPWDYTPLIEHLRERGLCFKGIRDFWATKTLTYEDLLHWIRDGALTSLLALEEDCNRQAMAAHMTKWLARNSIPLSHIWDFHGGLQIEIFSRTII